MYESAFGITLALHRVILGTWDASINLPDLGVLPFTPRNGQKYYVSVTGTIDIGNGLQEYTQGDYITYFEDTGWIKDDNTPLASETGNDSTVVGASVADALEQNKSDIDDVALDLTTHTDDTNNPHLTTLSNLGDGTLVELNALLTDLMATYGGVRDFGVGTLAQRPVFGVANRFFWTTDENTLYRDTGGSWASISATPIVPVNTNMVYVSKVGNDLDDGLTEERPKLTIGSAITQASTMSPTSGNRITILVEDGGDYAESIILPLYVNLEAPTATLMGNAEIVNGSVLKINKIISSAGHTITGDADKATIDVNEISTGGVASGGERCIYLTTSSANGSTHIKAGTLTAGDLGECIMINGSATLTVYASVDRLLTNGVGIKLTQGNIDAEIKNIEEFGASLALDIDAGIANIYSNRIATTTAYDVESGATLNLFCLEFNGAELNDGIANVFKGEYGQLLIDATATERGLMGITDQTFAGLKTFNTPIRMPSLNINELLKGDSLGDVVNSGVKAEATGEEGSIVNMQKFTSAPIAPIDGDFWFREDGAQTFIERYEGGVTYSVEMGSL